MKKIASGFFRAGVPFNTYATLMGALGAYTAAAANDVFQIRKVLTPLAETLLFDRNIFVTLDGGKANDYVTTSGDTVFNGPMRIRNGKIVISRIKIK